MLWELCPLGSKIFEKSMHIHLVHFLQKNKVLFCYQFGFWNGYSVNHAITSLTELTRKGLDEGKFMCGVFTDLQKAFDTVDHNILLSKLCCYGVKGTPHQWFKSYLIGKQQYTTINHQKPCLSNIKYWCTTRGHVVSTLYQQIKQSSCRL